jgi:hypothetical protein
MHSDQTTLIYTIPNGDTWWLCREAVSGKAFVKHRGNASSGGHETDSDISDFLNRGPRKPEQEALLRLMADGAAGAMRAS